MRNIINYIFIGGFLFFIWSPFLKMNYSSADQISNSENRKLSNLPKLNLKDPIYYMNEYERYFNDNFGFRTNLITWNNYLSVMLINESPVLSVVMGLKGWLFFAEGLADEDKRPPYTPDNLRTISTTLEQQTKYLNNKGITLITVIVPSKHTIYPEMLPFYLQNHAINPRMSQRLSILKQFKDVQIINLVPSLLAKKSENNLYYKTDTHWNNYGSFVAYEELMKVIKVKFPQIEILNKKDFDITIKSYYEGDLLKILRVPFRFSDEEVVFTLKNESKSKKLLKEREIPKVLISHDSFFDPQYPWGTTNFLANHFSKVIHSSSGLDFDRDLIEKEMPNVVILEIAERSI